MKRILTLMLLLLVLAMTCVHAEPGEENITLIVKAEALAAELDALAENEAYIKELSLEEQVVDMILGWGAGNHDTPARVLMLDFSMFMGALVQEIPAEAPEAGRVMLHRSLGQVLLQAATNAGGADMVAASAVARTTTTFAAPVLNDSGVFLLLYEDATPVGVSWYAEEGAVSMTAVFLPDATAADGQADLGGGIVLPCAEAEGCIDDGPEPENAQHPAKRALALAAELRVLAGSNAWHDTLGLRDATRRLLADYTGTDPKPRLMLRVTRLKPFKVSDDRLRSSILPALVAMEGGTEPLSAMSSVQAADLYAEAGAEGEGMYLLLYEDGAPVLVTWAAGEDAVSMSASFLPLEGLADCQTRWEVQTWAEQYDLLLLVEAEPDPDAGIPLERIDSLARMVCGDWPAIARAADLTYAEEVQLLTGCTYQQPYMTVLLEYAPKELSPEEAEAWARFEAGETLLMTNSGPKSWDDIKAEPAPSDAQLVRMGVVNHIRVHTASYFCEATLTCNAPDLPDMSGGALRFYADGAPLLAVWDVADGKLTITLRPVPDADLASCRTPEAVQAWLDAEGCTVRVIPPNTPAD